jgi:site-specific DNA-methyltransferase (adenine-specific)
MPARTVPIRHALGDERKRDGARGHRSTAEEERMLLESERWRVEHGDALALLRSLPSESAGALITDPPYSSGGFTRGDRSKATGDKYLSKESKERFADFTGDNRDQRGFVAWCSLWMGEAFRVLEDGAPVVVFTDWRQLPVTTDAVQIAGFVWRGVAVWTKENASRPQLGRFRADAEFLVWGSKGPMRAWEGAEVLPGTFAHTPVHSSEREHQTEKPLALMEDVVRIARPGALVVDPFCGSGTTGVAAIRHGRRFLGCELSATYWAKALERLRVEGKQSTLMASRAGQLALFASALEVVNDGPTPRATPHASSQ